MKHITPITREGLAAQIAVSRALSARCKIDAAARDARRKRPAPMADLRTGGVMRRWLGRDWHPVDTLFWAVTALCIIGAVATKWAGAW